MSDRHHHKPYPLRMPDEMRSKLEAAANSGGRSLHAEILRRIEWALLVEEVPKVEKPEPTSQPVGGDLTWYITTEIKKLAEAQGVPFDEMLAKIFVAGLHPDAPQVLYAPIFPGATSKDMRAVLEASDAVAKPDAALVSEMIQRAPWAPAWLAERLKAQGLESTEPQPLPEDTETETIAVVQASPTKKQPRPAKRILRVRKDTET